MRSLLLAAVLAAPCLVMAQAAPKLNEKLLREAMADQLKDADSAKFKSVQYLAGDTSGIWKMCGEVNAKNSYGGYAGFTRFYGVVAKEGKQAPVYVVMAIGELADTMCQKINL